MLMIAGGDAHEKEATNRKHFDQAISEWFSFHEVLEDVCADERFWGTFAHFFQSRISQDISADVHAVGSFDVNMNNFDPPRSKRRKDELVNERLMNFSELCGRTSEIKDR